jgi:site-specific DNA recombinase
MRTGVPTRTDWRRRKYPYGVWNESTVRELLISEASVGTWHYGKKKRIDEPDAYGANGKPKVRYVPRPRSEWIPVAIPAIVDRELWQIAQERLSENKAKARRNRKSDYLFASMASCDACKGAYVGNHGERAYERRFYVCRSHSRLVEKCTMPAFRELEIDMVVWPWIKQIATHFERVEATLQQ